MLKFNASRASISTYAEVSRRVSQMMRGARILPPKGNTNTANAERCGEHSQVRSSCVGGAPVIGAAAGFDSFIYISRIAGSARSPFAGGLTPRRTPIMTSGGRKYDEL